MERSGSGLKALAESHYHPANSLGGLHLCFVEGCPGFEKHDMQGLRTAGYPYSSLLTQQCEDSVMRVEG